MAYILQNCSKQVKPSNFRTSWVHRFDLAFYQAGTGVAPNSCLQVLWEKNTPKINMQKSPNLQKYLVVSTHLNILVKLNWMIISSGRGENETYLKPPTRIYCWDELTTTPLTRWQRNQPAFWSINMISLNSIPSIPLGFLLFRWLETHIKQYFTPYDFSWWCTIIENDNRTCLPTTIQIQVQLTPWLFTPKCKWNCRAEYQISVHKSWSRLCVWCVFCVEETNEVTKSTSSLHWW